MTVPSISQTNKAGKELRNWQMLPPGIAPTADEIGRYVAAYDVLVAWRSAHQYALTKANVGLRSVVRTVGCVDGEVSSRLKRIPTILNKLVREPTLALANMQDIGGCRAVVGTITELRRVEARVCRNRDVLRTYDYVASPRSTGYRSLHMVVAYEDRYQVNRKVELQIRTQPMHSWAIFVERATAIVNQNLKGGEGPPEFQEWLRLVAEAIAIEEMGGTVATELADRIGELRRVVEPLLHTERRS